MDKYEVPEVEFVEMDDTNDIVTASGSCNCHGNPNGYGSGCTGCVELQMNS